MRFGDIQLAFPFILLAITILGLISNRNAVTLILVIGIPTWIIYARVVRSRVMVERDKDYVLGAKAIGASRMRQMGKYILPTVWTAVLVIAMLDIGYVILLEFIAELSRLWSDTAHAIVGINPRRRQMETHSSRLDAQESFRG